MGYLVALDDGHGMETAGKRTPKLDNGQVIKENQFNRAVVGFLAKELNRCGIDTIEVSPTDRDTSLSTRVEIANKNKADIYVSIHYNAFDGKFNDNDPSGLEVYHWKTSDKGKKLAECVHKYLVQGTKQKDRGVKVANFYVLRETNMPAILTENGFMDNKFEAMLMVDVDFQKEVAQEHAKGICEYFGVEYVQEQKTEDKKLYKVQVGAFVQKENAEKLKKELQALGYKSFIKYE